jgi:hypothetical protein
LNSYLFFRNSFGLGHHHQGKGQGVNALFRRSRKPFVPCNKRDAQRIIQQTLQKIGLRPLELLYQLLDNPRGGAPVVDVSLCPSYKEIYQQASPVCKKETPKNISADPEQVPDSQNLSNPSLGSEKDHTKVYKRSRYRKKTEVL